MKTHAILDADGELIAFELDNAYISRKEIAGIVKAFPHVTDLKLPARFGSPGDDRVRLQETDAVQPLLDKLRDRSTLTVEDRHACARRAG